MSERGAGWISFSAVMLMIAGVMRLLDGIWALQYKGALPSGLQDGLLGENLKNYGWMWILVGIVIVLAGVAVLQGSGLGKWIGVIAAAVLGLSAVVWMPYYPIWSLAYVGIATLVIYGLVAYGGQRADA
jgi:hypothetical protein